MNVTIAIDSFKECATSEELAQAIKVGIAPYVDNVNTVPISDGGEGTIEALHAAYQGDIRTEATVNAYGEPINAEYLVTSINGKMTAVVESAKVIGIHYSNNRKEQAHLASSYGLGLLLAKIMTSGMKQVIVTLGGSGTTDGGLGMFQGLGATLLDSNNQKLPNDWKNPLLTTQTISLDSLNLIHSDCTFIIANDVENPYCGPTGAAKIFGLQKGLTEDEIKQLDEKLRQVAEMLHSEGAIDLAQLPGAGAAGGLGGAFALLGAKMQAGFPLISELVGLEEQIKKSDWVITGEGRFDAQSKAGKVPYGVASLAQKHEVKTLVLCGSYDELPENGLFNGVFSIQRGPVSLHQAMKKDYALENIEQVSQQVFKLLTPTNKNE
ncbi:glycerate 2-kinase [Enterococcus sp. AZ194]|uniref:glycerate kinase family protein n=1 Tax=Enterococcus sp. AZ194 TaxID=2774629 RepID=UPI003F209CBA